MRESHFKKMRECGAVEGSENFQSLWTCLSDFQLGFLLTPSSHLRLRFRFPAITTNHTPHKRASLPSLSALSATLALQSAEDGLAHWNSV